MLTGQTFDNFFFEDLLGSGGMGDVYAGIDLSLQRKVAIKVLKPELLGQPELIARFKSEAISLAQLNHPNVATIFAFIEEKKHNFLVIEFIPGWELSTLITKCSGLPIPVALLIFKQILAGVLAIHKKGIVHRDLKPSNIMITDELLVKVMDFGLARFQSANRLTSYGKLIGTIEYMSPEQICGEQTDQLSDIYSLGILLFEIITGQLPFSSNSEYGLMKAQIEAPPPSPLKYKNNTPESLVSIISTALAKSPKDRYQSVSEFSAAIDSCLIDTVNAETELKELINKYHLSAHKVSENKAIDSQFESSENPELQQEPIVVINQPKKPLYNKVILFFAKRVWLGPLILLISFVTVFLMIYLTKDPLINAQKDTLSISSPGINIKQPELNLLPGTEILPSETSIFSPAEMTEADAKTKNDKKNSLEDEIKTIIPTATLPPPQKYTYSPKKQTYKHKETIRNSYPPKDSIQDANIDNPETDNTDEQEDTWKIRRQ